MSNYTQITAFTPKDSLATGNPSKVIRGADFDGEFSAISAAISTKADTSVVDALNTEVDGKQDTLVSGTNIKTVGGTSLLGSGDIAVGTGDVTLTGTQTLTNKTLTSPVITENVQVISTNTNAVKSVKYIFTASLVLTLPATPTAGDAVSFQNSSGVLTCSVGRNGSNIMSLAEDLTVNTLYAPFTLLYADATRGWVFI